RLAPLGARLALRVLDQLAAGTTSGVKQDKAQVTRAPKLTKEHGLIDWTRPARAVCNQVRAMQPWPTAYTYWHRTGKEPWRLILQRATWHEGDDRALSPGQVVQVPERPEGLSVTAGQGSWVEVLELQPE